MQTLYLKLIDVKTNKIADIDTMVNLGRKYKVDKTALFQAEKRNSNFLRRFKVRKSTEDEYLSFNEKDNEKLVINIKGENSKDALTIYNQLTNNIEINGKKYTVEDELITDLYKLLSKLDNKKTYIEQGKGEEKC